ncbi:Protein of unknown function [Sporobacter termitidis DSM 10068]|uniref:Putative Se/S carrier protein-like domain-containing protein n=1 Tax=Sporobacter termitidis DSM 10068 TaxID=1123282 RepID=A0A1M5UAN7_9FIRM|nr:DUF3343 domain-containing protein [Sporobacter termitidis]SHH60082.1 Protein of unknown function [Sporobacter termitidis DSM 10068]
MTAEYIITFDNTSSAIKAEQYLLAARLRVGVMPLPSQVRAGCGICLRLPEEQIGAALEVLCGNSIADNGVYVRTAAGNTYVYGAVDDRSDLWNGN